MSSSVPQFRQDPITSRWVIIAGGRHQRPNEFEIETSRVVPAAACPFCEGQEAQTPPEVLAWRPGGSAADGPGWTVRVVPNKFPAVGSDAAHEVIVESPRHADRLATMGEEDVSRVLWAWQQRIVAAKADPAVRYAVVFKNHGAVAGATLEHAHSQLLALPVVPEFAGSVAHGAREGHAATGRCRFCDAVQQELQGASRIVEEGDGYLAFTPYASRFPFETWILPRAHAARFEEAGEADLRGLARRLGSVLRRMESALERPAFNLIVHTAPFVEAAGSWYHWHLEIVPKLTRMGGFEWGTGFYINSTAPEQAAEVLRGADI